MSVQYSIVIALGIYLFGIYLGICKDYWLINSIQTWHHHAPHTSDQILQSLNTGQIKIRSRWIWSAGVFFTVSSSSLQDDDANYYYYFTFIQIKSTQTSLFQVTGQEPPWTMVLAESRWTNIYRGGGTSWRGEE